MLSLMRTDAGALAPRRLHGTLAGLSPICHEELVSTLQRLRRSQKTGQQLGTVSRTMFEAGRLISHSLSVRGDRRDRVLRSGRSNPADERNQA